ncbi:hypothetical protein [Pseudoalteromonas sp. S16_S37]|uniref:hypothetical protein n=1 Tax=Pseudoalteromonas sp. S16_S37 TaxID=2720228 RepID=UPI001681B128|nr:hypothetical protein [Pseudoalteromonas sp. S16_S37]MBD1582491.1 hypothetical protein [Pseudoalteromonas sp. S16_S37]
MQNTQKNMADNCTKGLEEQDVVQLCAQCIPLTSEAILKQAKLIQHEAALSAARSHAYQAETDGLALKYLAAQAQYGECHEYTVSAKTRWLSAREAIQARYPKS